ncbi:Rho GTPase activation protein [Chytriomyces sp. MP71]|nr:Rho GTPase activation protein [Chytriomyces sp. MP71]
MVKLSPSILNSKSKDGKQGSYSDAWKKTVVLHEQVGEIRLKFASSIVAVAEEVSTLHKNTERSRKQLKEAGYKHWRAVHESENALEKAKSKYEACSEDWERAILNREQVMEGATTMMMPSSSKAGLAKSISNLQLWKAATSSTNPIKVQKLEDDARARAAISNENYKQQLATTNTMRTQYFQVHLPRFIRMLLETNEACDHGLQTQLIKHARELEEALIHEATTLSPIDAENIERGIVKTVERVNNSADFEQYMVSYFQTTNQQLQKTEYQYSPYSMSPEAFNLALPKPVFGVDLAIVTEREGAQVPSVVEKYIQAVERHGLRTQGVYRVSAAHHNIQQLRNMFDRDSEKVNLEDCEEISVVASALKLYFRELPDSLFPKSKYYAFIDAARHEDDRMRLIAIHELVNQLSDAHYSTLSALMGHLYNVQHLEAENRMGIQNLAIVWGPTLLDSPGDAANFDTTELRLQSRVVETVLANYSRIFDV